MTAATVLPSLGLEVDTPDGVHESILHGFPVAALDQFVKESRLPADMVLRAVGLPPRTLARRRKADQLSPDESDRLYRLAGLHRHTLELFGGSEKAAARWLGDPQPVFGGQVPLEMARTEVGVRRVETLISQLQHGVFV